MVDARPADGEEAGASTTSTSATSASVLAPTNRRHLRLQALATRGYEVPVAELGTRRRSGRRRRGLPSLSRGARSARDAVAVVLDVALGRFALNTARGGARLFGRRGWVPRRARRRTRRPSGRRVREVVEEAGQLAAKRSTSIRTSSSSGLVLRTSARWSRPRGARSRPRGACSRALRPNARRSSRRCGRRRRSPRGRAPR